MLLDGLNCARFSKGLSALHSQCFSLFLDLLINPYLTRGSHMRSLAFGLSLAFAGVLGCGRDVVKPDDASSVTLLVIPGAGKPPTASVRGPSTIVAGTTSAMFSANAAGGRPPYVYVWTQWGAGPTRYETQNQDYAYSDYYGYFRPTVTQGNSTVFIQVDVYDSDGAHG